MHSRWADRRSTRSRSRCASATPGIPAGSGVNSRSASMIRTVVPLVLVLLASGPLAAQKRSAGSSQEFVVEGSGGGYEVLVSPTFVTVFYLPEKVTRAFGS